MDILTLSTVPEGFVYIIIQKSMEMRTNLDNKIFKCLENRQKGPE